MSKLTDGYKKGDLAICGGLEGYDEPVLGVIEGFVWSWASVSAKAICRLPDGKTTKMSVDWIFGKAHSSLKNMKVGTLVQYHYCDEETGHGWGVITEVNRVDLKRPLFFVSWVKDKNEYGKKLNDTWYHPERLEIICE